MKVLHCGVKPARAHFSSGSEEEPFSLPVTVEQAVKLGRYIDKEIDLVFTYRRNRFGRIDDGEIEDFHPMEVDDDGESWLDWLTRNGKHWDDVKDHLEELGRRHD